MPLAATLQQQDAKKATGDNSKHEVNKKPVVKPKGHAVQNNEKHSDKKATPHLSLKESIIKDIEHYRKSGGLCGC